MSFLRPLPLAAWFVVLALPASAQSPSLTQATPGALVPGQATELILQGANLSGATNLWTGFKTEAITPKGGPAGALKLSVKLGSAVPVGVHAVRVASTNGVSNPLLLMVDDLPSVPDAGTNTSPTNAQALPWPVAVDGAAVALKPKCYRVTVKAGERLAIEVVAQRLGSKLDPVLRLLDAQGRELAFCDDESGLSGDCRIAHVFAAGGDYFIEVRDINYGGGADYRFRLRVGDFPLVNLPFPAGVKAGSPGTFTFVGPQVEKVPAVTATAAVEELRLPLSAKFPGGKSSGFGAAVVSGLTEVVEAEPNENAETATPFTLPAGLNGRFLKAKERDFWKFSAKKGQRVVFTAQTRSLGSASEVMLQLRDAKGTALISSAVNDASEGAVTNSIPADGTYFLVVDELIRRGGPQHAYRVEAELQPAGFALEADAEKAEAAPGGSFTVKVTVARRDYTGPITLSLAGIEGAKLADEVIKDKAANTTLKVTLPDNAEPGSLTHFRIVGRAKIGEVEFATTARTTLALRKIYPTMPFPPRELDGPIALGVKGKK